MELRVLRYFIMVVTERNISRAAEKLHVSQPTISRQLKELEDELGVTLFARGSRTIDLTNAGNYFYDQARQIVALSDKTMINIQQKNELGGSVTIGCAEVKMMATIADAVATLKQSAPKFQINLYSTDADDVRTKMAAGLFDFGVVMEPIDKSDYNFAALPGSVHWGILTKTDSPLAQKTSVTVEDLKNADLIMPQQSNNRTRFEEWIGNSEVSLSSNVTYNLLNNALILAEAGVGNVLCLDGIANTTGTDLSFVPLTPQLEAHASLVWSKNSPLSASANAFLETMQTTIAEK